MSLTSCICPEQDVYNKMQGGINAGSSAMPFLIETKFDGDRYLVCAYVWMCVCMCQNAMKGNADFEERICLLPPKALTNSR